MPLSQDFANSRLEYLQSAIKNNNVVSTQFYPRFQRQYNEMFPFTEGSNKIENPQQSVVSSSLNPPSLEMAKENLKTLLIPYVGDQADVIITALKDTQISYYEEHFNEIQKELLKRIKIPTSIESYLTNLKMVFNNEKNRSNLTALKDDEVKQIPTFQSYFSQNPFTPTAIKTTPPAKTRTSMAKKSTSLPRNNLNRMMSMVRRGEVTNLRHYTNNILNTPKQNKSKNQNQAKKKRKISTSSPPSAKDEDFYGSPEAKKALDDFLEDNPSDEAFYIIDLSKITK
jgi:hypothetical protein